MSGKLLVTGGSTSKRSNRARALRSAAAPTLIEMLEGRVLLAVTSTTPMPFSEIEQNSFSSPVLDFTANDAGPFLTTINWGDGTAATAGTVAPVTGGFEVDGTHTYADLGTGKYTVSVTITDTVDDTEAANTTTATVGEALLSLTADPASATVGQQFTAELAVLGDPGSPAPPTNYTATIDWNDGTPNTAGTITGSSGTYDISGTHTYAQPGNATATVIAYNNGDPGFNLSIGVPVTVAAGATVAMTAPTQPIIEGGMLVYSVTVKNTSTQDEDDVILSDLLPADSSFSFASFPQGGAFTAAGQTVSGDLGTIPAGGSVTGTIVAQALEEGSLTNTVSASYNSLSLTGISQSVSTIVLDAPLTPTSGKSISATKGTSFTGVVGSFTDADPNGTPTDYTASINWGDGHTSAGKIVPDGAGFDVVGTNIYAAAGASLPITVSVKDAGGSTATLNSIAHVADVPPPPPPPASKVSIITDPCNSSKTAVEIDGSNNNDTITVTRSGSAQGKVVVKINNVIKGTFSFSGSIVVHGMAGNDNISIDSAITRQTFLFGEAGNDTLSGGGGSDVIVGGDGNDKITGNAGRDLLFGSNGSDSLNGGADDDLLDAGTTSFDTNITSLCKLQDEWVRTDKTYAQRVSDITNGGGLNGSVKLNATTSFSSSTLKDTLVGGTGSDLFFASATGDVLSDKASGETLVKIG